MKLASSRPDADNDLGSVRISSASTNSAYGPASSAASAAASSAPSAAASAAASGIIATALPPAVH